MGGDGAGGIPTSLMMMMMMMMMMMIPLTPLPNLVRYTGFSSQNRLSQKKISSCLSFNEECLLESVRVTRLIRREQRGNTGEEKKAAKAAKFEVKPMGPKPPGCYTLFMGNLNFGIDDDTMYNFFKDEAGAEMVTAGEENLHSPIHTFTHSHIQTHACISLLESRVSN